MVNFNMLKYRIIPTLLLKDGRMVKSRQFGNYRDTGNPITAARVYDAQRADELIFLDISASTPAAAGRAILFDIIKEVSAECFMPLGVGGGIRSVDEIRQLLKNGADKVVINTAAHTAPGLIQDAAEIFGSSTIVASIDVKNGTVWIKGGTENTGEEPIAWAKTMEAAGAGEIFLTSIDRDGVMAGYDIELIRSVADAVSIPVIASGGVGTLEDLQRGIEDGHASAVAAASIFHFTDQSPIKARKYLVDHGVAVRP